MHCYCRRQLYDAIENGNDIYDALNFKFQNGEKYCAEWLPKYLLDNLLVVVIYNMLTMVLIMTDNLVMNYLQFFNKKKQQYMTNLNSYTIENSLYRLGDTYTFYNDTRRCNKLYSDERVKSTSFKFNKRRNHSHYYG